MSVDSFVRLPGQADRQELWALRNWLPHPAQVRMALQLRIDEVIGASADERENEGDLSTTSMRQGIGLIVALGLMAGALPFLVNLVGAIQAGTALPLAQLAQAVQSQEAIWRYLPLPVDIWVETAQTIAGLDTRLPGWLAALLSALGEWVNWPLGWLTGWLVYGLAVLLVTKLLGATTTLQRFYTATAYAWTPLLLTIFSPIPCLGAAAALLGGVWMVVMYIHAVYTVSGLDMGRVLLSLLLPWAVALLGSLLFAASLLMTAFA
jgi:hypothetical protein